MKSYAAKKLSQPKLMEFRTTDGLRVLCGKNNHQNDWLTTRVASKSDYWFHVKNQPGSHCVLFCEDGEPTERNFTEAATIAAYYSKASDGQNVAVDYTLVKNVRQAERLEARVRHLHDQLYRVCHARRAACGLVAKMTRRAACDVAAQMTRRAAHNVAAKMRSVELSCSVVNCSMSECRFTNLWLSVLSKKAIRC